MTAPRTRDALQNKIEKEARNFVRLQRDLAQGRLIWESRPLQLEYSFNTACNLRCVMCKQSENPPVIKSKPGQGEALLEWFGQYGTIWTPSATSEPLANNLDKLLAICEERNLFLELITNAMLLTPEVFERLLPRIHLLTISIDSHEKAVLERVRFPAKLEVIVEHSRHALARCRELQVAHNIHCVLMRENLEKLDAFVDFCADLGTSAITLLGMLDNTGEAAALSVWRNFEEGVILHHLERMKRHAAERGVNLFLEVPPPHGGNFQTTPFISRIHSASALKLLHDANSLEYTGFCPMVSNYLKVTPEGDAYPCCRAHPELLLGNVFEEGFDAVWNGEKMQALRRRFFEGDLLAGCVGCSVLEAPKWAKARES